MDIVSRNDYRLQNLDGIEDVQAALEKLTHDLRDEDLKNIVSFNHTYLVITRRVKNEIQKGAFQYPDFLQSFDTIFADYYFSALKGYLRSEPIPKAWELAFDAATHGKAGSFISMALGVNAHVNNDIAQVLVDSKAKKEYYKDYLQINNIIGESLNEVIDSLPDDKILFGPKNFIMRPIYTLVMNVLIFYWRKRAWKFFLILKENKEYVINIKKSATFIAKLLVRIPL